MAYTGIKNAEYVKAWRDKKRALGLCIKCGKNRVMNANKIYPKSKCRPCLILAAIEQADYRERIKGKIKNVQGNFNNDFSCSR